MQVHEYLLPPSGSHTAAALQSWLVGHVAGAPHTRPGCVDRLGDRSMYPSRHSHVYPSSRSRQSAFGEQVCLPSRHSSTNFNKIHVLCTLLCSDQFSVQPTLMHTLPGLFCLFGDRSVYPCGHSQVNACSLSRQSACWSQSCLPVAHSFS